jgi:MFS family permease
MFLFGVSLYGAMLLMPLYYQQVRGQSALSALSALSAGLLLAPQGLGTMLALTVVGKLTDAAGPRRIVLAGMTAAVAGTIAFTQVGPHTSQLLLAAAGLVRGAGLGAATIPVMATAYRGLRKDQIPGATTMINVLQRIGASAGTAVIAVILQRPEPARLNPGSITPRPVPARARPEARRPPGPGSGHRAGEAPGSARWTSRAAPPGAGCTARR